MKIETPFLFSQILFIFLSFLTQTKNKKETTNFL